MQVQVENNSWLRAGSSSLGVGKNWLLANSNGQKCSGQVCVWVGGWVGVGVQGGGHGALA